MKLGSDYKIEITKGSGPGGQHRNKVETCVKIIHIPSGITETCQETRSKTRNFNIAKKRIEDKIRDIETNKKNEQQNEFRKKQIKNTKRRRTYDFKSKIVYDHLTGKQAPLNKIMDGNLDLLR